jgi:hypothetical protein
MAPEYWLIPGAQLGLSAAAGAIVLRADPQRPQELERSGVTTAAALAAGPGTGLPAEPTAMAVGKDLPCLVGVWVKVENERPVCDAVWFMRREDDPPLTPHKLRRVPLRDIVERTYRLVLASPFRPRGESEGAVLRELGEQQRRWRRGETQYTRLTDGFLRRVAEVYRQEDRPGGKPTLAVARRLDANFATTASTKTAQRWVAAARSRGFLARAAGPGRKRRTGESAQAETPQKGTS